MDEWNNENVILLVAAKVKISYRFGFGQWKQRKRDIVEYCEIENSLSLRFWICETTKQFSVTSMHCEADYKLACGDIASVSVATDDDIAFDTGHMCSDTIE